MKTKSQTNRQTVLSRLTDNLNHRDTQRNKLIENQPILLQSQQNKPIRNDVKRENPKHEI